MEYVELNKVKENKEKIDMLVNFLNKGKFIACTKHTYDVDHFGDSDTCYSELGQKEKLNLVYRFLGIDVKKLEEETKLFVEENFK